MQANSVNNLSSVTVSMSKVRALMVLLKFRLSLLVVFSSAMGFILAVKDQQAFPWTPFIAFCLASLLITGASNTLNQVIERHTDKLMDRTRKRPMPLGILSVAEACAFALVLAISGMALLLYFVNTNAALLGFLSLLLYVFAYTPMKTKHPVAVFIGAIPGAFPPMIGWVAATNQFGWEPGVLFAIQFFWQFPHFWAIAWVLDEDYKKAGIRLLPGSGQDVRTAFQIMIYTMVLIPLGFVPYMMGMAGKTSAIIAVVCGMLFLAQTFWLMRECTRKAAKQIMFGSFLYLPIVQIAYVLDK